MNDLEIYLELSLLILLTGLVWIIQCWDYHDHMGYLGVGGYFAYPLFICGSVMTIASLLAISGVI